MLKIGLKVAFSTGDEKVKDNLGIIIDYKNNDYVILAMSYKSIHIKEDRFVDTVNNIKQIRLDIVNYYTPLVNELKCKLRTVTSEEKVQERADKYNRIKKLIIKNCERVAVCTDDDEFENRLKEINKLKKELHTIDLECGDTIRKENGKVKFDIKGVEQRMNSSLNKISDETIAKVFEYR